MNENIKNFNETAEAQETVEVVEVKKAGLIERFKALKTWQKVLVIVLLTGTVAVSVKVIYDLVSKKPEAVASAIDAVVEGSVVDVVENAVA